MAGNIRKTALRDDVSLLPSAEELHARLLHRDAAVLILNKPAGIAVHPTAHDKVALDQMFEHLRFGLPRAPALAHRLDRETSGCLVLGRHRQSLDRLGKLFASQQVEKTYLAVVNGVPKEREGIITQPIRKTGHGSKWRMELHPDGQEATTHYTLRASDGVVSVLVLSPKTGRTHQIRLHCLALGCPVVGDRFYAPESEYSLQLHARSIAIPYDAKKEPIRAEAPLPQHMQAFSALLHGSAT